MRSTSVRPRDGTSWRAFPPPRDAETTREVRRSTPRGTRLAATDASFIHDPALPVTGASPSTTSPTCWTRLPRSLTPHLTAVSHYSFTMLADNAEGTSPPSRRPIAVTTDQDADEGEPTRTRTPTACRWGRRVAEGAIGPLCSAKCGHSPARVDLTRHQFVVDHRVKLCQDVTGMVRSGI